MQLWHWKEHDYLVLTVLCTVCNSVLFISDTEERMKLLLLWGEGPPLVITTNTIIIILTLLIFNVIQVVDQYLPDCHVFLGGVFIEVSWHSWVGHVLTSYPSQVASRTHVCLLHLLVKLANEPNVRQVNMSSLHILPCLWSLI